MSEMISISETEQGREFWLGQGLAQQHLNQAAAADVLIVPLKDFRPGVNFAFHQDTAAFFRFLSRRLEGTATIEILADDPEYMELSLHAASHRLSTIVVSYVLAPLVMNMVSSYLYDEIKAKPQDSVELTVVIEDHECRAMRLAFKGEAKDLALIADKVGQISRDCISATNAREHHQIKAHTKVSSHEAMSKPHAASDAPTAAVSLASSTFSDSQASASTRTQEDNAQSKSE